MKIVEPTAKEELIRPLLDKVLSSKGFSGSPILSRFLRFVVEKTLAGEGSEIKEYTVGTNVLGKPLRFNPLQDASVRIHAVRLRKLLREYYEGPGQDDPLQIDLPRGAYRPAFLSNEGLTRTALPDYTVGDSPAERIPDDIIGVVPFQALIDNDSLDFSPDGFCEFLSEKLSLFQDIRVLSYYSVSQFFKGGGKKEQLGQSLGLTYYLSGSIEIQQRQFIASLQLNDAQTNAIIWSQVFPVELEHGSIQTSLDQISSRIVASLAGYTGIIHHRTFALHSPEPVMSNKLLLAVFWFYHYQTKRSEKVFKDAIRHLELAVQQDGSCALCWAVLAHLYADGVIYNYPTVPDPLALAHDYVERSLALDPNCQHAWMTKAWLGVFARNKTATIEYLEKCDAINPNSSIFKAMYSLGMAFLGEYEKSLALKEKALPLNPLPYWWLNLPNIFVALKKQDYSRALYYARKIGTPQLVYEHIFELIALYYLGETDMLRKLALKYREAYPSGFDFILQAFPAVLFDEDLVRQLTLAIQEIRKIIGDNEES